MSVKAMNWALYEVEGLKPTTRLVLAILADRAGHDGTGAFPSKKTIGKAVGIDPRNVLTHLKQLESLGIIKRGDQRHVQHYDAQYRPTVYDLCMDTKDRLSAVMPASPLDRMPASPLDRTKRTFSGDARGDASITQTFKPEDKPAPRAECRQCNRDFAADQVTSSGLCRDCLINPAKVTPTSDQGIGFAMFKEAREKQRTARRAAELRAAEAKAALKANIQHRKRATHV